MSHPLTPDQVEIADGMMLSDLLTVADCDMAHLTLTRDIGRIEEQLADPMQQDTEWAERAASSLRFKKSLRQTVTMMAADLRRAERQAAAETRAQVMVSQFKADWPAQFAISRDHARENNPNLWRE